MEIVNRKGSIDKDKSAAKQITLERKRDRKKAKETDEKGIGGKAFYLREVLSKGR